MNNQKHKWLPYAYAAPSLIIISLIVIFPILYTGYISLTNMNVYNWFDFRIIGFDNYKTALFVLDTGFLDALWTTILWTAANMVFQLVLAYVIASVLNHSLMRFRGVFKTIMMFPWAMPGYVSILLWKTGMFNTRFGLFNQWLVKFGFEGTAWLSQNTSAFFSAMVVNLWLALPFMIMIMDGALQSVSKSYYEYAMMNGATALDRTRYITLPLIRPVIAPAVVITLFTTFKQFDVIFLLIQQAGSKSGAEIHTVLTYAYENAFVTNNYGFSSAISIIIFIMLIAFTLLSRRKIKEEGHEA